MDAQRAIRDPARLGELSERIHRILKGRVELPEDQVSATPLPLPAPVRGTRVPRPVDELGRRIAVLPPWFDGAAEPEMLAVLEKLRLERPANGMEM